MNGREALPSRRLERPQPAVEDARHRQHLVRRDLAVGHRLHRRVIGRHDVAGARDIGQIDLDLAAARARHQPADDEARRHRVAGERLVDDDAGGGDVLALRQRLAQHGGAIARAGFLPRRIARLSGQEPPVGVAHRSLVESVHGHVLAMLDMFTICSICVQIKPNFSLFGHSLA